jgi:hypothetical protein
VVDRVPARVRRNSGWVSGFVAFGVADTLVLVPLTKMRPPDYISKLRFGTS